LQKQADDEAATENAEADGGGWLGGILGGGRGAAAERDKTLAVY
jgi:hypothetical protein